MLADPPVDQRPQRSATGTQPHHERPQHLALRRVVGPGLEAPYRTAAGAAVHVLLLASRDGDDPALRAAGGRASSASEKRCQRILVSRLPLDGVGVLS